ncbi:MAG TPA: THUMP domain-containing protein [Candidatus Nanopelagicaceae bacterium]|nr:THUMP domain-containing protein [Candidatus Nanopelagicaceae bacterium]
MNNFNLLVSTSRFNEVNAKAEIWFTLLMCGDKYPIILGIKYPGLITATTNIGNKEVILKIKKILEKDSRFFQFILKIVPINYVCETKLNVIKDFVEKYYPLYLNKEDSYKIELKRRKNEIIERDTIIESVAKIINNRVDLDNPDKILRIEILGNVSGISFLNPDDIIIIHNKYNQF